MARTDDPNGHVFIVRGNLLHLACDAIVVPTDGGLVLESPWHGHIASTRTPAGGEVSVSEKRVRGVDDLNQADGIFGPLVDAATSGRQTWLVATGVVRADASLLEGHEFDQAADALRGVLLRFAERFLDEGRSPGPRGRPLIAVPLLGHGRGGFAAGFRRYARTLITTLQEVAEHAGADVALVIWGAGDGAGATEALCRQVRSRLHVDALAGRWQLGDTARPRVAPRAPSTAIERLIEKAGQGELVPFFGAG